MGDDDARDRQAPDGLVDGPFVLLIKMAGGFIEQQDAGSPVKRARQHDALHLSTRQRAPHIADQCLVAHWHTRNLFMNSGKSRHLLD